jgi:hypothetical protein
MTGIPSPRSAVCTLFEGHYHFGVGALINSLHRHGFQGKVVVGYRGTIDAGFLRSCRATADLRSCLPGGIDLEFRKIPGSWHLTNLKPDLMVDIFVDDSEIDRVFYLDPDIVIRCPWSFFDQWAQYGVALCQELVMGNMPETHPLRRQWADWASRQELGRCRSLSQYFNAGFIGIHRRSLALLNVWQNVMQAQQRDGLDMTKLLSGSRADMFHIHDQDALNLAAMLSDEPLSVIGPEGMDFVGGGFTMSHAAGGEKPWKKRFLRSALRGVGPTRADRGYWENVESPISLYAPGELRRRRRDLKLGAAVGRVLKRG